MTTAASRIALSEIKDLVAYEKVREEVRARVIALKKNRRLALGENLTVLFENRETVLFQIQEMIRTERIVDEGKIQDEIAAYDVLLPSPGELSATLFIEIPEIARMTTAQMREAVNRFQGLDQEAVWLHLGATRVPAASSRGTPRKRRWRRCTTSASRCPPRPAPRWATSRRPCGWWWSTRATARKRWCPRRCARRWPATWRVESSRLGGRPLTGEELVAGEEVAVELALPARALPHVERPQRLDHRPRVVRVALAEVGEHGAGRQA